MDFLRLSIAVLTLSSITSSLECPKGLNCEQCEEYPNGKLTVLCNDVLGLTAFRVDLLPSKTVSIICLGYPNWKEFYLGKTKPIKDVDQIYIDRCDLPETGFAAVMEQLLVEEVSHLDFQSLKTGTSLTKESLRGFNNLQKLVIRFSKLMNLTENVFEDLKNLTDVDLQANDLEKVPENFFRNSNLVNINLGTNRIKTFEVHTFDELANLRLLNISQNELRDLLPQTFDGLYSLEWLAMNGNFLESLPDGIFKNMSGLEIIYLSDNNFTGEALPKDLFKDKVRLWWVEMNNNKRNMTSLPDGFFANLPQLELVDLMNDGLIRLPEDLFWGSKKLYYVGIHKNYLNSLPSKIFNDATEMEKLLIGVNELSNLPDDIFDKLGKLKELDLSRNHFTNVNAKLFAGLKSLEKLWMYENRLKTIDMQAFISTQNLRIANFGNNELTLQPTLQSPSSSILSPFHHCSKLEYLILWYNNVSNIFEDWQTFSKLKILNLSHNHLQVLRDRDLQFSSEKLNVNLDYNEVTNVDLKTVETWAVDKNRKGSVLISIENNPIRCDCGLYDFLRYLEGRMHPNVNKSLKLLIGESKCHGPSEYHDMTITDLRSETLQCNVNEGDFQVECPDKCKCFMRPEDNAFIVDCTYKGLTEAPRKLDCPRNYRIDHIELNLTGNYLTKMPDLGQNGYNNVTILGLDHNNISSVTLDGLSNKLQVLKLNNNKIIKMSSDAINFLKNATTLQNLTLEANPWLCDCDAVDFRNFIKMKSDSNPELLNVKCNGYDSLISEMTPEELCPTDTTWKIAVSLTITFAGMIIGILAAIYYRYQQEIKVWLYAHKCCLWCVTEDELDRDKIYDAFVCYSHKDDDFVENNILQKLEEGPKPYKLCIHTRDWLAGEWIPNQIVRSIEQSRRTIIILSPNFIESIWGRMEFRTAHCQTLKEGRARVIIVVYGEIGPTDSLDPELKAYLNMNTYIKWGDRWFWEKLKYALSHPSQFTNGRKSKYFADTKPSIKLDNNKCDVVNYSAARGITSGIDEPFETCVENRGFVNGPNDNVEIGIDVMNNECKKFPVDDMNRINSVSLPSVEICEKIDNSAKAGSVRCGTL